MNKAILSGTLGLLFLSTTAAQAGFNGNTAHSRANCVGFNESVTWNALASHYWEVNSIHWLDRDIPGAPDTHNRIDKMRLTWRSIGYDYGLDPPGAGKNAYSVSGYHFYLDDNGYKKLDVITNAINCSIYDGWWDTR